MQEFHLDSVLEIVIVIMELRLEMFVIQFVLVFMDVHTEEFVAILEVVNV